MTVEVTAAVHSADLFRALSDPTRLALVRLLTRGESCVCELAATLGVAQPLVSHHLKMLRRAGFLQVRREGRWHYYALDRERFEDCQAWIRDALAGLDASAGLDRRCCPG